MPNNSEQHSAGIRLCRLLRDWKVGLDNLHIHRCPDWDYLLICKNDLEFECCNCNLGDKTNSK